MLDGRVDVYDELNAIDVHASRSNVSCDKHPGLAAHKLGQVAVARVLREVALQLHRGDAPCSELLCELFRLVLHACKENAAAYARSERLDKSVFVALARNLKDVVGELRNR